MINCAEAVAPLNEIRAKAGVAAKAAPTMADLKHKHRVQVAREWTDRLQNLKKEPRS